MYINNFLNTNILGNFPSHDIRKIVNADDIFMKKIMMIIQLNVKNRC